MFHFEKKIILKYLLFHLFLFSLISNLRFQQFSLLKFYVISIILCARFTRTILFFTTNANNGLKITQTAASLPKKGG
jgi:hypothetical protein